METPEEKTTCLYTPMGSCSRNQNVKLKDCLLCAITGIHRALENNNPIDAEARLQTLIKTLEKHTLL